jgi:hypothetical protein
MPRVDLTDTLSQRGVIKLTLRRRSLAPLVETLPRHAQHAAHESDRECLLRDLFRDKREPYWFWLAKVSSRRESHPPALSEPVMWRST